MNTSRPTTDLSLSRRRFLTVAGGTLGAGLLLPRLAGAAGAAPAVARRAVPGWASAALSHGLGGPTPAGPADSVLVLVQLNGGNDGLNTVVPTVGHYFDARPTIRVAESELLNVGWDGYGLHPALAPMTGLIASGRVAAIHGIGFDDPNRSHFVSMDRWWRGGRTDLTTGWIGRAADARSDLTGSLASVALGSGAPVMVGEHHQPTVVIAADGFRLPPKLGATDLSRLATGGSGEDDLTAAVRASYARGVDAVGKFGALADGAASDDEAPATDAPGALTRSLRVAADLVQRSAETRLIVVSGGGFDTHAGQIESEKELFADLATGLAEFQAAVDRAGMAKRVRLAVVSEFGRRVAENASGGTDHGAGGLAFVIGDGVRGGVHGELQLAKLLDGDVPPTTKATALFTSMLQWWGADAQAVLGTVDESLSLTAVG